MLVYAALLQVISTFTHYVAGLHFPFWMMKQIHLNLSHDDAPIITTTPKLEGQPCSSSKGETTDFSTNPHVIPVEPDKPLMQSNQALLMHLHEQLGHCSFTQLKTLAEKGIIP